MFRPPQIGIRCRTKEMRFFLRIFSLETAAQDDVRFQRFLFHGANCANFLYSVCMLEGWQRKTAKLMQTIIRVCSRVRVSVCPCVCFCVFVVIGVRF